MYDETHSHGILAHNTTLNSEPSAAAIFSCNSSLWCSGTGAGGLGHRFGHPGSAGILPATGRRPVKDDGAQGTGSTIELAGEL